MSVAFLYPSARQKKCGDGKLPATKDDETTAKWTPINANLKTRQPQMNLDEHKN